MRVWLPLLVGFSAGGLASALLVLYLFYALAQLPPGCFSGEVLPGVTADCVRVLTSGYAYVGPVPLDGLAAVWFAVNMAAALWLYRTLSRRAAVFVWWWRLLGLAILPYLVYLELAVLKAVCIYCTVMHAFIVADFAVITLFLRRVKVLGRTAASA